MTFETWRLKTDGGSTVEVENGVSQKYVLLTVYDGPGPFRVSVLSPEQARLVASKLIEAADALPKKQDPEVEAVKKALELLDLDSAVFDVDLVAARACMHDFLRGKGAL